MVTGVTDGYTKELELIGVGYRAGNTGNLLELTLGYSHPYILRNSKRIEIGNQNGKRYTSDCYSWQELDKQLDWTSSCKN